MKELLKDKWLTTWLGLYLFFCILLCFPEAYAGNVVTMFKSQGADVTAPTVSTATIGTNGTSLTLAMSETVTRSGGTFDVDCNTAGSNLTCTYSSGSGSNSLVYTIGTTVNSGDTCNLDYDGASNGIEDGSGNDLAAITSQAVTNNSTQGGGPDAWYYSSGLADNQFSNSASYTANDIGGDDITITTGGSLTKVSWRTGTISGSHIKICLTDSSTNEVLACEEFANTSGAAAWHEGTLTTPLTVTNGQVIKAYAAMESGGTIYYAATSGGLFTSSYTYANLCSQGTVTSSADYQHALGVYVD